VESKLRKVFAKVFEMEEDEITDESSPGTVVLWDSLRHLQMIMEIESAFHMKLTMKEIRSMGTFARIREVVAGHLKEDAAIAGKGGGFGPQQTFD
jgi:acyl carrier protein